MDTTFASSPSPNWIISRRDDLLFFIGSALFGYALIAWAFARPGLPSMFLVLFAFAIDGPHIFSTLTRSLLDKTERTRLRRFWLIGFPVCVAAIGTLALTAGSVVAFITVTCLSHYHISKQHMGFVMIYKRKAREKDDYKVDKYFTIASLMLPLGFYFSALFTFRIPMTAFLLIGVLMAIVYSGHQLRKPSVNLPKLLLLAAFIPLQWFAWKYRADDPRSLARLVVAGVAMNVGHSLQYLRLMYFHNHNRYSDRSGVLALISRRPIYFIAAVITLALPSFISAQVGTFYLSTVAVGMLLFHFVVDARIWRLRGDKDLAAALQL